MIHLLIDGVSSLRKTHNRKNIAALLLCGILLSCLLYRFHLNEEEEIKELLNDIIQFTGIFSAILITFIVSKVFQIRQERLERKKEITKSANKTSDFRRIARILKDCRGFWDKDMRSAVDYKYKNLSFFDLRLWDNSGKQPEQTKLIDDFCEEKNMCGAYLYLAMKSLVLDDVRTLQHELYDRYDYDFTYPLKILEMWRDSGSGNSLWFHLSHKGYAYKDCFHFDALRQQDQDEIVALCKKINPQKYDDSEFDENLLASVSAEFESYILPRLHDLTYDNTLEFPKPLNFLWNTMFLTIISGVLLPLFMISIKMNGLTLLLILSNFAVWILLMSLLYFLLEFKKILIKEIKIE